MAARYAPIAGLIAAVAVLVTGLTVVVASGVRTGGWSAEPGKVAADFRLPTADGRTLALADLRGSVVAMLVVPPEQVTSAASLQTFASLASHGPLKLLAVATTDTDPLLRAQPPIQPLLDRGGDVAGQYLVLQSPTVFLIDRDGTIRHRGTPDAAASELPRLLAEDTHARVR